MRIAVPKEVKTHEYRVGLCPEDCAELINAGNQVSVQSGAGLGSSFNDQQYEQVGCKIIADPAELHNWAEMIIKVKEPQEEELAYYRSGLIIYTYFHLAAHPQLTQKLLDIGITALAYETLQLEDGSLPCLKPMSQIAGRLAVQEGAKYLEKPFGGRGVLLSGVPGVQRGKVLVLGAGSVGVSALKIAVGMGAQVTIMDIKEPSLSHLDEIYQGRIQTLYASEQNILKEVQEADLIIGAVLIPGGKTPQLVKKSMLKLMKPGAVIVDVAVDQGGCVETSRPTTHDDPIYEVEGIVHYCVSNMPGAVSLTSTRALTAQTLSYAKLIAREGLDKALEQNSALRHALNLRAGQIIHPALKN